MTPFVVHSDDVPSIERGVAPVPGTWTDYGRAAGSITCGVRRLQCAPGHRTTPVHREGADEEFFFVLAGGGLSWQDGKTYEVRAGDTILHRRREEAHTLIAGPEGIDVLAYGTRYWRGGALLPRAGVAWHYPAWVRVEQDGNPFELEAALGELDVPAPSPRKDTIIHLDAVEPRHDGNDADALYESRIVGRKLGALESGFRHIAIAPDKHGAPPHCHSAEEEIFHVLTGDGILLLGDERIPVRAGHWVVRPAGTRVAHAFQAGPGGLGLLAYSTVDPNDIAYFPRSNKVFFRGVGVLGRIEHLDYWDGERF